jgi:Flp pilus assembly protein TadD
LGELAEWEAPLLLADVMANVRKYDQADREYLRLAELYPEAPAPAAC